MMNQNFKNKTLMANNIKIKDNRSAYSVIDRVYMTY